MNRYEEWILAHIVEHDGASMTRLYDTAPFGRDNVRKAVKALTANGDISRQGVTIFPTARNRLKPTEADWSDRLKPTEADGLVPPHAPPPKDLKPGSNRAREADPAPSKRDPDPYVVACKWQELRPGNGLCDFGHQTFFGNRNDAYAHFRAHCRQPHPSKDWAVTLVERKTGENLESWSTAPYEPVPYEVGRMGINAFIKREIQL